MTIVRQQFHGSGPEPRNGVIVSAEYLGSLDANTPLKVEVGAIERRRQTGFIGVTSSCVKSSATEQPGNTSLPTTPEPPLVFTGANPSE